MGGVNFADIEVEFVRERINPAFAWVPHDTFSPMNPLQLPLADARVAFVTTSGAHLPEQPPFDLETPDGDPTYREFPTSTPLEELVLTHRGYNTRHTSADKNAVLPLDHLRAAVEVGRIGSLAGNVYSTMGFVADVEPLMGHTAPAITEALRRDRVDLVLLAPT
jgi:D-proline reductase (dithiol) PrdB